MLKDSTRQLIAAFRSRRTAYLTTPALRRLAAECTKFRREHWGHNFTRQHESAPWNNREYVVMSQSLTGLDNSQD